MSDFFEIVRFWLLVWESQKEERKPNAANS